MLAALMTLAAGVSAPAEVFVAAVQAGAATFLTAAEAFAGAAGFFVTG